jgi:hypothetical protein
MKAAILNLDALRALSRKVQFLGREYELGYIPSGAAIPILDAYTKLLKKQEQAAGKNTIEALNAYSEQNPAEIMADTIRFIARFCAFFYPEKDAEAFEAEIETEASKTMVDAFFTEIIKAIITNAAANNPAEEKERGTKKKTGRK